MSSPESASDVEFDAEISHESHQEYAMSLTVHELEAEARHLTAAERADLAQRLFASLEDEEPADSEGEMEQAWLDEAERRYARYVAGETQSVPAADALARVRARLDKR